MAVNVSREKLIEWGYPADVLDRLLAGAEPSAGQRKRKPAWVEGQMNETEKRFAAFLDDGKWPHGTVVQWEYEKDKLVLSPDMTLLIDFTLTLDDGSLECVDVKGGFTYEDSIVKNKAASVIHPERRFYVAVLKSGEWRIRRLGVAKRKTTKVKA